jgi:hypothetical protein
MMGYLDNIAVLDIEATGLNPGKCAILSIGLVSYSGRLNEFYREYYPFEGAEVMEESMKIKPIPYSYLIRCFSFAFLPFSSFSIPTGTSRYLPFSKSLIFIHVHVNFLPVSSMPFITDFL